MVHRVAGPISAYRGEDDGTDRRIWELNQEVADVTVFQSQYSFRANQEIGLCFKNPAVILNAVDPRIFHPPERPRNLSGRKIRIVSTSWSKNPNKGTAVYKDLEDRLDWDRFEYTFVGRSPVAFDRIRMVPPMPSRELAQLLRQHDIYITASVNDPCSNALLEALASGLPAVYADSGGHPEIVGEAGLAFSSPGEIPSLLDRLIDEYVVRQSKISVPSLAETTDRYLSAMAVKPD